MGTDDISNFIRINEQIGTAGQPTEEQLRSVRDEGYTAVINLAPENPENYALPDERGLVTSLGMEYHNIPVEWSNPDAEDFEKFCKVMDDLRGNKVFIHCAVNFRVTAFYSLYAMKRDGWSSDQANELIAKVWESLPDYSMDDTWKSFIKHIRSDL